MIAAVSGGVLGVVDFLWESGCRHRYCSYMMERKTLAAQARRSSAPFSLRTMWSALWMRYGMRIRCLAALSGSNIVVSVLIGLICFVALSIIDVPYAPLLAVLLGVTNLIPFSGHSLGAIPSAICFPIDPIKEPRIHYFYPWFCGSWMAIFSAEDFGWRGLHRGDYFRSGGRRAVLAPLASSGAVRYLRCCMR